jgi:ferric-dicitrate binding protein FerR (iron transport regulator)
MKHDEFHDREPRPDSDLQRMLDAAETPPVRAEFRERLRRDFVRNLDASAPVAATAPRRSSVFPWAAWVAGAIAAGVLAVWWTRASDPPQARGLELVERPPAGLRVDGAPLIPGAALLSGARLSTAAESVRLRVAGVYVMELGPHTSATLARGFGDDDPSIELTLASGSLRVVTGAHFAPRRFTVKAPDAEVLVIGTEFGIDVDEAQGTCVCCNEGSIEVRPRGSPSVERLVAGGMVYCFASDMAPMLGEAKAQHLRPITELRRAQ